MNCEQLGLLRDSDAVKCDVFASNNFPPYQQLAQKVLLIFDSFNYQSINQSIKSIKTFNRSIERSINTLFIHSLFISHQTLIFLLRFKHNIMCKTFKSPQTKAESNSIENRVRFAQPTEIFPSETIEESDFDALKKVTWYQPDDLKSFRSSLMSQSSTKRGQGSEWDPFDTRSFSERQHNRVLSNRLIVHVSNKLRQSDNTVDSEKLGEFAQKICHKATEEAAEAGFRAFYYAYAHGKRDRVAHDEQQRCVRQRIEY